MISYYCAETLLQIMNDATTPHLRNVKGKNKKPSIRATRVTHNPSAEGSSSLLVQQDQHLRLRLRKIDTNFRLTGDRGLILSKLRGRVSDVFFGELTSADLTCIR